MRKIFSTTFYPYKLKKNSNLNKAVIGVGGNVGNVVRRFKKLFLFLNSHPKVIVKETSVVYRNPPFGYLHQDDFYNTVIIIETKMSATELLNFLLYVEKKFKRKRAFKNSPRTLDLDIILFNNLKLKTEKLSVPHPFFKERDSVLVPLVLRK
jgi:2-amino-4-hydroxy-6-hydroxymethyldihydropteridine diphosphokinase